MYVCYMFLNKRSKYDKYNAGLALVLALVLVLVLECVVNK